MRGARRRSAARVAVRVGRAHVRLADALRRAARRRGEYGGAGVLGALGVGGTFALSVVMRSTEFGVLRALGAQRGGIRGLVLLDSLLVGVAALVIGIPTGLLMGAAAASSIGTLLRIGLPPAWDPALLRGVAAVCLVALILAALAPSRRAATTDPIASLRV